MILALVSFGILLIQQNNGFNTQTVYADPRLASFLWLICIAIVIEAFRSIKMPIAQRNMDLKPLIILEISAQLVAVATMIAAVNFGAGVYSLVIGMIASAITSTAGSFLILKGPGSEIGFNRTHFFEIFNYGKWLLLASFFGFIATKGNQVLFGFWFEKTAFSFFVIATIWITAVESIAASILQRIAYPAFSEIFREDKSRLTKTYETFRLAADAACVLIFFSVFLLSDFIFGIVYTDEYAGVATYVKLLSLLILFLPYRLLNTVLLAAGDSRRFTVISLMPSLALLILTPFMFFTYGEKPAIIFVALLQVFALPFIWKYTSKLVNLTPWRESLTAGAAILSGILMLLY